jgi:hypothetical protein
MALTRRFALIEGRKTYKKRLLIEKTAKMYSSTQSDTYTQSLVLVRSLVLVPHALL